MLLEPVAAIFPSVHRKSPTRSPSFAPFTATSASVTAPLLATASESTFMEFAPALARFGGRDHPEPGARDFLLRMDTVCHDEKYQQTYNCD